MKSNPMSETTYWERTDTFEEKMRLLEAAWRQIAAVRAVPAA